MGLIKKRIVNNLMIRTDPVDDMVLVRVRWEQDEDDKFSSGLFYKENLESVLDRLTKPDDLENTTIQIPPHLRRRYARNEAYAAIIANEGTNEWAKGLPPFLSIKSFSQDVDPNLKTTFVNGSDHTYYDRNGNILNRHYFNSLIGRTSELEKIIAESESLEWLDVLPGRYGPIYYVRDNGSTINIRITMTEDEYIRNVMQNDGYSVVGNFFKEKGIGHLVPRRDSHDADEDYDDDLGMD